jgi:hypothetical protein
MALSVQGVRAFLNYAPEEVVCVLLTITHSTLATPIRVTDNGADIVSNGNTFIAFPFQIDLPADNEQAPVARLTIANVDGSIGEAIDGMTTPPYMTMQIVLASSPNNIEMEFTHFRLQNITVTAVTVEAEVVQASLTAEPWPSIRVTPARFPALFG